MESNSSFIVIFAKADIIKSTKGAKYLYEDLGNYLGLIGGKYKVSSNQKYKMSKEEENYFH